MPIKKTPKPIALSVYNAFRWWPHQESNLDLELRKLLYYPLYYEAGGAKMGFFTQNFAVYLGMAPIHYFAHAGLPGPGAATRPFFYPGWQDRQTCNGI